MIIQVPINTIYTNPYERRRSYSDAEALAADIGANGLGRTLTGRLVDQHGCVITSCEKYGLAAGLYGLGVWRVQLTGDQRLLQALRVLDGNRWTLTVPVDIQPLSNDEMLQIVLSRRKGVANHE